jgi:hypothetical protein
MKPLALDVDLLIEQDGRQMLLRGSGTSFTARFPTLTSLFHFARLLWRFRGRAPRGYRLRVQWRWLYTDLTTGR